MMPSDHPQFLVDALYCDEEHHLEGDDIDTSLDSHNNSSSSNTPFLELLQQDLWEDDELASLLHKEQEIEPHGPSLANARGEAVAWMLNVADYYSFSALTAVLAVNYLDRFLHSFESHGETEKPWMTQLAAVACVSLAAKVEETHVPLLLDLQVEDSKYVFDSKTIQRMEILVLSTLEWKMNPVTPLCFLDCIAKKMGFFSREFLRRCHCLLLSLLSDCRFMRYLPSALATATMLYVITSFHPILGLQHQDQLLGIFGINKDNVEKCCRLIQEVATTADFFSCNKRKSPRSPKGVVDACFSSDDSYTPPASTVGSVSSSPEPLSKRIKSK